MQRSQPDQEEYKDDSEDHPALSKIIERNIRTILYLRLKAARERGLPDRLADTFTSFSGAIFLSPFVLIRQNRLSEETEHRADLALQIGLLTEHELTRVLQMLDAVHDKMGIKNHEESELADLEMETKPEDVLAEIVRFQHWVLKAKIPNGLVL